MSRGARHASKSTATREIASRDHGSAYEAAGVRVIGISPDEVTSVKKFADKFDLGFTLLADADHSVAEAYGTWVEKSMYGWIKAPIKANP